MANWTLKNLSLRGISACLPKNIVYTKDMSIFTKEDCEKFLENVGIESRRIAPEGVCASDLCYEAAEKLIGNLNWDKKDIQAIVFVSQTADYFLPATSCIAGVSSRNAVSCGCGTARCSRKSSPLPAGTSSAPTATGTTTTS